MKRAAVESVAELHEASTSGSDSGSATPGNAAIPVKSDSADGVIDFTGNYNREAVHFRTFTYTGTTWLNNLNRATTTVDSDLWSEFPWEYGNLFVNDAEVNECVSKYNSYKPVSCSVIFGDAMNYTQINTGDTPIMIPNSHQKLYAFIDSDHNMTISSKVMSWGESGSLIPDSDITVPRALAILQSWRHDGYNPATGVDVQTFLDNQWDFTQQTAGFGLGRQHPTCKSIRVGAGHKMEFHWSYKNKYWRQSNLMMQAPIQIRDPGVADARWSGCREDEAFGFVVKPLTQFGLKSGFYDGAGYAPIPAAPSASYQFPTIYRSHRDPQPKLMLHLAPDIGVVGTAGISNCQINFTVKRTYAFRGMDTTYGSIRQNNTGFTLALAKQKASSFPFYYPIDFESDLV